jgi:ATP-dependent exoDNAse (exonuclease V) beta subunit
LYLSSVLKDGVLAPGRGSLAEVLPDSLKQLFGRAAGTFDEFPTLAWTGRSGRTFEWRLCRPPAPTDVAAADESAVEPVAAAIDNFGPSPGAPARLRGTVTEWVADESEPAAASAPSKDRVVGRLLHRLFQHSSLVDAEAGPDAVVRFARSRLSPDELASVEDVDLVAATAVDAWLQMRGRDDVREVFSNGVCLYEIPFSTLVPGTGTVLRGTIDCLVQRPDGSVTVVEFKSGRRRPSHQRQLAIYVDAARTLFPGAAVDGLIVYAS